MSWFKKESKYMLVATFRLDGIHTKIEKDVILYFYLYENAKGDRKYEHKCTLYVVGNNFRKIPDYCEKIYPWLQGKNFPDIPSYWDTVKERRPDDIKQMYTRWWS